MTLATSPERLDFLKAEQAKHRYMGLHTEIVGPEEIKKLSPITNTDGVLAALYDPLDGHLDPSGTTHAYAKAAKMAGAEIVLHNPVLETNQRPDGTWDVVTKNGTIHAQHVVNAGGLWAREVGAWQAFTCRCILWNTSTWLPTTRQRSTSVTANCRTSWILKAKAIFAKKVAAFALAFMNRLVTLGG